MPRKKTHEEFSKQFAEVSRGEYELLSRYIKSSEKVKVKHITCGYVYWVEANSFLRGTRCRECAIKRNADNWRLTHTEFMRRLTESRGDEFIPVSRYEKNSIPIMVIHRKCMRVSYPLPDALVRGTGCSRCSNTYSPRDWEFKYAVKKLVGDEYIVLGKYKGSKVKVPMKHEKCGNTFGATPNDFISAGSRCPRCKRSKGEEKVAEHLEYLGIEFEEQKRIGGALRADFYLPEYRSYIEYDGMQHYKPVKFWGGEETFHRTVSRDSTKNLYCEFLGFPLLRIPYWNYDEIPSEVDTFLREVKEKEENQFVK